MQKDLTYFQVCMNWILYNETGFYDRNFPGVKEGLTHTKELKKRCGLVNDPDDAGGLTKFGIAKNFYKDVDVANITLAQAEEIYVRDYWNRCYAEKLPFELGFYVFDACVNMGVGFAAKMIQVGLGVEVDGKIGPKSLAAMAAIKKEDIEPILMKMHGYRSQYYKNIVHRNPTQIKFLKGWLRRCDVKRFEEM